LEIASQAEYAGSIPVIGSTPYATGQCSSCARFPTTLS
jgi:hypothetical protein